MPQLGFRQFSQKYGIHPCPSDAALKYTVTALRVRFGSYAVRELSEVPLSCNG